MDQKIDEFSMKEAMRFAGSDAGKALFAVLRENHGNEMQQIQQDLASGNMNAAKDAILKLLNSPDAKNAMDHPGGKQHG